MTELHINHGGIPYRAVPSAHVPADPDLGAVWFVQYQVLPDVEWRPRATFYEKDGEFTWKGQTYSSARDVLEARVAQGA